MSDGTAVLASPVTDPIKATLVYSLLVIEDTDTTRRRICSALRARGYRVEEAFDGVQAMHKLAAAKYDAIVLDLILPRVDGWKFREAQLRDPELSSIPTVVISVKMLSEADKYVLRPCGVIQKPFEDEVLLASVAKACATSVRPAATAPVRPAAAPVAELFWSRRGEIACRSHAPDAASERWAGEGWTAIPGGAGRNRIAYQCQHCSGGGPIHHRRRDGRALRTS